MSSISSVPLAMEAAVEAAPDSLWRRIRASGRIMVGGGIVLAIFLSCLLSLGLTFSERSRFYYDDQRMADARQMPSGGEVALWFGTDNLGRSILGRCLFGGAISLAIGLASATLSVTLGVSIGLFAGYRGGWIDATLMRCVDILYGLPYILLVILFKIAFEPFMIGKLKIPGSAANFIVLFAAIGLVSWLTMARVIRGQVLSLRSQPFIEACKAAGLTEWRIFTRHLLPNLMGPIMVYATLIVPAAILNESFLSFLGIGIQAPIPTWGSLASEGLQPALNPISHRWWMLMFPCLLLAVTLVSLNFLGDGLRDVFDPKRDQGKL